jgi:hypothetical protein
MKTCLIKQPAGIGDIFLCQKIAKFCIEELGCEVIWPVLPQILWIKDYLVFPGMTFVDERESFPHKDLYNSNLVTVYNTEEVLYIPAQSADQLFPHELILNAKYILTGMDIADWARYFTYKRNAEKENYLFYDILRIKDGESYSLVNKMYGTPPTQRQLEISVNTDNRVITVEVLDGISVFDWCLALTRASSIHFVDSCYSLVLESLKLEDNINLYSRTHKPQTPSFSQTRHLFSSPRWNWIQL